MTIGFYIDVVFNEQKLKIRVIQDDENVRWVAGIDLYRVAFQRHAGDGRIKMQITMAVLSAMLGADPKTFSRRYADFGLSKKFANATMKLFVASHGAMYLRACGFAPADADEMVADLNKAADEFITNYAKEKQQASEEKPDPAAQSEQRKALALAIVEAGGEQMAAELASLREWITFLLAHMTRLEGGAKSTKDGTLILFSKIDALAGRIGALERHNAGSRLAQLEEDFSEIERKPRQNGVTESEFILKEANRLYAKGKSLQQEGR